MDINLILYFQTYLVFLNMILSLVSSLLDHYLYYIDFHIVIMTFAFYDYLWQTNIFSKNKITETLTILPFKLA